MTTWVNLSHFTHMRYMQIYAESLFCYYMFRFSYQVILNIRGCWQRCISIVQMPQFISRAIILVRPCFQYTCIRVYVHTRMRPYAYASIRVCVHTRMRPYAYASIRVCVHTRMRPYAYASIRVF